VSLAGGEPDGVPLHDLQRLRRRDDPPPAAVHLVHDVPAQLLLAPLGLLLLEEGPDRLGRLEECRILGVDEDLGDEGRDIAAHVAAAQGVEHGLLQDVAEAALRVGDQHVQRFGGEGLPRRFVLGQQLAHLGPVAVRDHQVVVAADQGHQVVADVRGVLLVDLDAGFLAGRHEGMAAERHDDDRGFAGNVTHGHPPTQPQKGGNQLATGAPRLPMAFTPPPVGA